MWVQQRQSNDDKDLRISSTPLPVSATQISVIGKIKIRFHVITGILLKLNPQMAPEHSLQR